MVNLLKLDWKAILTAISGAAILIMQIVNVILSNDIDSNVIHKSQLMEQKAADLRTLVEKNRADLEALHDELHQKPTPP